MKYMFLLRNFGICVIIFLLIFDLECVIVSSADLHKARNVKDDEFYTCFSDIEKEMEYYKDYFQNKIVYCNCDDPVKSEFWRYFCLNFTKLGLKELISTYYDIDGQAYETEYFGENSSNINICARTKLLQNGDFRSAECINILKQADIIVTNPPFSLFRTYVSLLMKYQKKFLILGSKNAVTYKDFFPFLKNNEIRFGINAVHNFRRPDGSVEKLGNVCWYTNFDVNIFKKKFVFRESYSSDKYPRFDNYDAININRIADIPSDYYDIMGVPITFLDVYNPEQFELLGFTGGVGWNNINKIQTTIIYENCKQHNPDGTITNGSKVNTGAVILYDNEPDGRYYTSSNRKGYLKRLYGRVLIRRRH